MLYYTFNNKSTIAFVICDFSSTTVPKYPEQILISSCFCGVLKNILILLLLSFKIKLPLIVEL